jgi:predicted nucleotidyltransferase
MSFGHPKNLVSGEILANLINGRGLNRGDRLLGCFFPFLQFAKTASLIIKGHRISLFEKTAAQEPVEFMIPPYSGDNRSVRKMADRLKPMKGDILAAVVHGSLATRVEIPYSDFDALLILKDSVLNSRKRLTSVVRAVFRARKIMLQFDPLQHHGWFILLESDLKAYPENYLPVEVLRHSRSLLGDGPLPIHLRPVFDRKRAREDFARLCEHLIHRLISRTCPHNVFTVKGLLSQFMLLPALFLQVKNGKGVFKKDSFEAAKIYFSEDEWNVMEETTRIRNQWAYRLTPIRRWILTRNSPLRDYLAPRIAPGIPRALSRSLSPEFYDSMRRLVLRMRERLS